MKFNINFILLVSACFLAFSRDTLSAQEYLKRLKQYDIIHYDFNITLSETSDELQGSATIQVQFLKPPKEFVLDLATLNGEGTGMKVSDLWVNGEKRPFTHENDMIQVEMKEYSKGVHLIKLDYSGVPANGLIIRTDADGRKTFFGDNWPNRAHYWIPCNDHSSDKATVSWTVTAPAKYRSVATGAFGGRTISGNNATTRWSSTVPLPPKVLVIGMAEFAVRQTGEVDGVPVTSWIYARDSTFGFENYAQAPDVLNWFVERIGQYPFEKLANVQSTTMFGGMENAGNIFYYEQSVQPGRDVEGLLAHEIAHQWYGNSVTEIDWAHVWLSEGFATYLTDVYMEDKYGRQRLKERMASKRGTVIAFNRTTARPVVDTETKDYMQLLNANSYQKGAWVLHMLRKQVGDDAFNEGLRQYYLQYRDRTASTEDFRSVMERVSGIKLKAFFRQWLYTPGHPILKVDWTQTEGIVTFEVNQLQETKFKFPLRVRIEGANGESHIADTYVRGKTHKFTVNFDTKVTRVVIDPDVELLWEPVED